MNLNNLPDKEKINNLFCYLMFKECELKNNLIDKENVVRVHPDTYNFLEYFKAMKLYENFKIISSDIEKIIF